MANHISEIAHNKDIISVINKHKENGDKANIHNILLELRQLVINSRNTTGTIEDFQSQWKLRITTIGKEMGIKIYGKFNNEIYRKLFDDTPPAPTSPTASPTVSPVVSPAVSLSPASASSSSTPLKIALSQKDKETIKARYNSLDDSRFLHLQSTKEALSVEQKVIQFGLESKFYHPAHSMILDLDDDNWTDIFSPAELAELDATGSPFPRQTPVYLQHHLDQLRRLTSARDAHDYARNKIDYDPSSDDLLGWLSLTILSTSALFLHHNTNIQAYPECDQLYRLWGFVNTIFDNSLIQALSKEISSVTNGNSINRKRRLSATEECGNRRMGRKMDTLYLGGEMELGCLEIGGSTDQTKEFKDAFIKMPTVMYDMLTNIVHNIPTIMNAVHIVGYNITGGKIQLMDMDIPSGYAARIRRSNQLAYPTCSSNYVARIIPLLEIAITGRMIMDATNDMLNTSSYSIRKPSATHLLLPSFIPSSIYPASSSSSSSKKRTKSPNS